MPIFLQQRRLTSLIVSLAILLNLCAPSLSQAVTLLTLDPLTMDICSASADRHAPAKLPLHGTQHCALCAAHTGGAAPPPAAASLMTVLRGHDAYPAAATATPPHSATWPAAQPRGPPAIA
ncbi:DUF2946 domain-containing protein [Duganella sp. FT80W]|uniref:DUF2946 domain-containing protein n=1 Tax=Duganella guangzhouensis TaxID=2666084 RepID=A0A6I2KUY3_9BURK|nr:DUF2946 family protein [Duganella guangzhouensis]MRW88917.1 DUF2946 domain-containing protein [Duganella guangzhouensis]